MELNQVGPAHQSDIFRVKSDIEMSGEYIATPAGDGYDYYVSLNPNYRINESLLETNNSNISANTSNTKLNGWQKVFLVLNIVNAGLVTWFIILTYFMQRDEKYQREQEDIATKVQQISTTMQDMHTSLKEINSSIQKLKIDTTISVRVVKP